LIICVMEKYNSIEGDALEVSISRKCLDKQLLFYDEVGMQF
jgi:hypothetical protein